MFTFTVLDRKYLFWGQIFFCFQSGIPFWENLVQKVKIASLSWDLVPRLIWIEEFNGGVHFFCFVLEMLFLSKFGPKNQNCQFKVKFGT